MRSVSVVAILLAVLGGCVVRNGFPSRSGAGVLTATDGSMYMVVTPCGGLTLDGIALMYKPPGTPPESFSSDVAVVRYVADAPVPASKVLAPLPPAGDPPDGWRLAELDDALLADALVSTRARGFDDYFYVEVLGGIDGTQVRLGGSWSADMSKPGTVVLGGEDLNDPFGRRCRDGVTGWQVTE